MYPNEKTVFSNSIGTVTNQRIIFPQNKTMEDVPVDYLTSVEFHRKPETMLVVLFGIATLVFLGIAFFIDGETTDKLIEIIFSIFALLISLAFYFGPRELIIRAKGRYFMPVKINIIQLKQGSHFFNEINKILSNHY